MVPARCRQGLAALAIQLAVLLAVTPFVYRRLVKPLTHGRPPVVLTDGPGDARFGLPLARRKEIFAIIAGAEISGRRKGAAAFPGQPWSQDDHRAAFERDAVRSTADQQKINLTQAYLVLDEGIRARWPGRDGKPLPAQVAPLDARRR